MKLWRTIPFLAASVVLLLTISLSAAASASASGTGECDDWGSLHPEWIFCDDFESLGPLVATGRYFEYVDDDGDFVPLDAVGLNGSRGMRTLFQVGEVSAGSLKLGFGRNPSGYMNQGIFPAEDFREIYYRMYLKMQAGWQGDPAKLSRATVFSAADWSQAMIAHLWGGWDDKLLIDPVRCVGANNQVQCQGYNDFGNMDWLGYVNGQTPVFAPGYDDRWYCIEARVRLNDPGQENGVQEFWIDGASEAGRYDLNFVRAYTDYSINAIFFENYWNSGSIQEQERYIDNIVVSRERIGCAPDGPLDPAIYLPVIHR